MDKKNSILIVDKDESNIHYLKGILTGKYAIYTASNVIEALEKTAQNSPDIILFDIDASNKRGFDDLAQIISSQTSQDIPIIFILSIQQREMESIGLEMGASDCITKPFIEQVVLSRVNNQIDIVNQKRALKQRQEQQSLVTSISQCFLKDEPIHESFNNSLQSLGQFMEVEQILLFWLQDDGDTIICNNEWINPVYSTESLLGTEIALDANLRSIISSLILSGDLCLTSNNLRYKSIMEQYTFGFGNFIKVPIFIKGELCAILGFYLRSDEPIIWDENEINLACVVGNIFSGAFELNSVEDNLNTIIKLQAEIAVSKYLAEQSSRAKSEFLSRMSHEMRTPMNAIIGMTNISLTTDDLDKKNECLSKVGSASRSLLRLIDDVLDMSDIEDSKLSYTPAEFSFSSMLGDVFDELSSYFADKHHTFTSTIDPSIPEMLVSDEKRLSQVIYNLLSNAAKFTNDYGKIHINVFILNVDNDLLTMQVEVSDNGIGISQEQQKKLFVAFEQVDGSINRKYGGAGLGLVISKNIVEMMEGELWVESTLGVGSTFYFTFKARIKANEALDDGTLHSFHGMTALLVEDVEINREIVMAMLEDTRMKIVCASNGREAVELFTSGEYDFDVIFMDINMPEMDGVEATKIIRSVWPQGVRIPIIAMTANVHPDEVASYIDAGMSGHIGKPIDFDKLLRMIRLYMH
ncbi:MAG: response regulator [Oscillospiraceae bacterium]|nr:response regulator [Oscillospiraceae bacterium]